MNTTDKLTQILIDTINQSKDLIKQGFLFTQEQIPDIIHQLLIWKLTESLIINIIVLICFLITLSSLIWLAKKAYIYDKKNTPNNEIEPPALLGVLLSLVFYIPTLNYLINKLSLIWLKILIAPKIYLIEYVTQLVK